MAVLVAGTAGGIAVAGCGGSDRSTQPAPAATAVKNPIPRSVLDAESGAEDTIDLALAGEKAKAVAAADPLNRVAQGRAATDMASAGIPEAQIAEFQARAAKVAELAPTADPLDTALASNRVFELVSEFLSSYDDVVPADVITLDYLDFEAKLQAIAGDGPAVERAVADLAATWQRLKPDVIGAGGERAATSFDEYVSAMQDLVASGTDGQLANEAQYGLDLVDEIEVVYTG